MEAEGLLALIDLVVLVIDPAVRRPKLGTRLELAELPKGVVRIERCVRVDEEVRLAGAGVVALDLAGLTESFRDPVSQMRDLVVVAD